EDLETVDGFVGQQRSCAGGDIGPQADGCTVADEVVKVWSFRGSPPVNTISGLPNSRTRSMSLYPSAVVSSSGCRLGIAEALQYAQARSQDCVTSQMTRRGDWLKSMFVISDQKRLRT